MIQFKPMVMHAVATRVVSARSRHDIRKELGDVVEERTYRFVSSLDR